MPFDPKTVVKTYVGEPPTLYLTLYFPTFNQTFLSDNETHSVVIFGDLFHNNFFNN